MAQVREVLDSGRQRPDSGQASLSLISYALVVALVAVVLVQGLYVSQALSVAQQAARDGAVAAARGENVSAAINRQVPGWADVQSVDASAAGRSVSVSVTVRVPLMVGRRTADWMTVSRTVVMPRS
jgi:hypothetical protein